MSKPKAAEDPMSAVDRLRKIILRCKNLGQEQTELSKIIRPIEGLRVERLSGQTGHMTVQPAGTRFEGYVSNCGNEPSQCFFSKQQTIWNRSSWYI